MLQVSVDSRGGTCDRLHQSGYFCGFDLNRIFFFQLEQRLPDLFAVGAGLRRNQGHAEDFFSVPGGFGNRPGQFYATALSLSFAAPVMQTPPIAWGLLTVLSCSILAGLGAENLVRAKKNFRLWTLICFVLTAALSAIAFANSHSLSGALFAFTALLTAATIPISANPANFRFAIWITFYTACCADILWGAKHTLEQIFGYGF